MPAPCDLERLYDEHARSLFAFLLNLTRDESDTRDLLQEVFVRLASRPGLLDGVRDEPILVSHLVRLAILDQTLQPAWEGLARHQWSEVQLRTLQAQVRRMDLLAGCHRALDAERAAGNLAIESVARQPEIAEHVDSDAGGWARWLPRGWFALNQVTYDRAMHDHATARRARGAT